MITEADARVLEYGTTIVLVAGGHVTPLAQDTLRARRVTVVREGSDVDAATLAPRAEIRIVAIAGDHTSLALKAALVQHLRARGLAAQTAIAGAEPIRNSHSPSIPARASTGLAASPHLLIL